MRRNTVRSAHVLCPVLPASFVQRASVACLILTLAAPVIAGAQPPRHVRELGELSLEELMNLDVDSVFGASRYVQKIDQAPASITIVTADEIERSGARTLDEVLNGVRGFYVSNDRNYSYLGIRGFQRPNDYNTRVLVLIDGHRMNDSIYDLGAVGREGMVDVDVIERVEVIRGPSSSIYGSSAFFGVINVITKRGSALQGLEVSAELGRYGAVESQASFGTVFDNGIEWFVSGSRYISDGRKRLYFSEFDQRVSDDPRARNGGLALRADGEDVTDFFSNVKIDNFTISAFWNGRRKAVPTASFDTFFNDGREETRDLRSYVDVRYERPLRDGLSLMARAFYDDYTYKGTYPYDVADAGMPPDVLLYRDKTVGRWIGTEWQFAADVFARHKVVFGGEFRKNLTQDQFAYYDVEPRSYDLLDQRESEIRGLFMQSETQIHDHLLLTAGVRYDDYSAGVGDSLNPRLGLIYAASGTGTLKVLYGEAFRAPNPYERYYYSQQRERPPLAPEKISTYELVYEKELVSGYRLTLSGYYYRLNDLISQAATDDADLYFDNLDEVRAKGVEAEVRRRFISGATLRASYALQEAVDRQSGERLSSSPQRLAHTSVSIPIAGEKLVAGIDLKYHGSVRTLGNNRTDAFTVANLTFVGRAASGLELSGTIRNVLDKTYFYPGGEDHLQDVIEQDGRSFVGKVRYRF